MVEISFNSLDPLGNKGLIAGIGGVVKAPVGHFTPGQIAQPVTMIKETGLKYLLVKPCAVEASRHGKADVIFQRFIGRGGVDAIGIEALIQDKTLENRFSVDEKTIAVKLYFTKSEIAAYLVLTEGKTEIIKTACAGFPKMDLT